MTANPPNWPQGLEPLRTELGVYYRELPRLLREGDGGRYAVVKGDTLYGTWDTFRDARQYGYDKFGLEPFLTQQIDPRFLAALAPFFGEQGNTGTEVA